MREVPDAIAKRLTDAADGFAASFEDLRMDDIARASGVPRATLYYHFSGKDDLLGFLFDAMLAEFHAVLAAELPRTSARRQLAELTRRYLAQLASRPAAAQLLLANLGRAGKLPDIASGVREALVEPFARVVRDGIRRGELRRTDADTAAVALFGSVTMVGLQALMTEGGLDATRLSPRLTDLFWTGLAGGAPTGRRRP